MVTALLNSVILIDHLNGIPDAAEWLSETDWRSLAISSVTRAEVLAGASEHEFNHISLLLDSFSCLPLDAEIADRAAVIRRENRLRLPDAFQAAVAERHSLMLITRNTRDFPVSQFPYVHFPYSLS